MKSYSIRILKDRLLKTMVIILSVLTCVPLILIIGKVLLKGYRQINLSFFTETTPSTLDAMLAVNNNQLIPGGIANGITGTMMMVLIATVIAVPIGLLCGVYLSENRKTRFAGIIRFLTEILQGTPSIITGIIAYIWVVVPMRSYSAIAGSISLANKKVACEPFVMLPKGQRFPH